jgi:hypothetical protein
MKAGLDAFFNLMEKANRLFIYSNLRLNVDNGDPVYQAMNSRAMTLYVKLSTVGSFVTPEILSIPSEELAKFIESPVLAGYRHMLENTEREREHVLDGKSEQMLAMLSDAAGTAQQSFTMLESVDMTFPEITDENGETVTVEGGVCDIAAAGLTVNEKRMEILDFSTSYYNAAQMIIAKEGDTTFADCKTVSDVEAVLKAMGKDIKAGVQNGTTGAKYCEGDADWGFDGYGFTTVGYSNGALAVQDMLNGNINFVIIDEGPAKAIAARVNEAN